MQVNVRKGSGAAPTKDSLKSTKAKKEARKRSGGSSQESREERRARRLQEIQAARSDITQAATAEKDSFAELRSDEPVDVPQQAAISEEDTSIEQPVTEPEVEESMVPEVENEFPPVFAEETSIREEPVEADLDNFPAFDDMPDNPDVADTVSAEGAKSGLKLGKARGKMKARKEAATIEVELKPEKPKKKQIKSKQGKTKRPKENRATEADSLDLAYAGERVRGGNQLSLMFILGMLFATGISAGAGYILSGVVRTILFPIGV